MLEHRRDKAAQQRAPQAQDDGNVHTQAAVPQVTPSPDKKFLAGVPKHGRGH